ncbi:hypothetical protein ATE84_4723 [Aquimarina sp. MAR_2010_214]|uniref:hypothetical protein n=1 Tax=Aquimarina sp. MAR_2010_214 TaxID=1250026 RepID=UPI000C70A5CE|nr:hypothetical protein [Aquimarina sp. MAR_2010_214]PKV52603.1 hypothetical protein ATE84_4723 [Aquimarina sp. MAR_2010_214]
MKIKFIYYIILLLCIGNTVYAQNEKPKKVNHDFELELEGEYRYFYDDALFEDQEDHFPSLAVRPEYKAEWNAGYESINFKGFFRLDVDEERTHWDIRELYYQKAKNNWEFNLGLKKVYWGVAESNHLVDIINQTDAVETFDGEEKLGQPMAQFTWITEKFGTFDFFYLPYHRKRTFSGKKGRLRFPTAIDKDELKYESSAKEWRQDVAFRWKHYFDIFDIGISHFYGTGREPLFVFDTTGNINAFYPVIHQTGLDLQITHDAFLWKLESIYRNADAQDFFAMVAGLEYTFSNIDGNGLDIGILGEYLYDERDELTLNALQNDIFFGSRIAFNDTQDTSILIGGIADLESSTTIFSLEASRRFGSSWTAAIEARIFNEIDDNELILSNFREDSFFRISISKYF